MGFVRGAFFKENFCTRRLVFAAFFSENFSKRLDLASLAIKKGFGFLDFLALRTLTTISRTKPNANLARTRNTALQAFGP